jgi:hypothetical protein
MVNTLTKILLSGLVATAAITGVEYASTKPIVLKNVQYTGYKNETSDGSQNAVFKTESGKTFLTDRDPKFDCNKAYKQMKLGQNTGVYNVAGYHGFFAGNVATNISLAR